MSQSSTELFETAFLLKIFHNEKLQSWLDEIDPSVLYDRKKRLLFYLMRECRRLKIAVSVNNMMMISHEPDDKLKAFYVKHKTKPLEEGEMYDTLHQVEQDVSEKYFDESKKIVLKNSFRRFIDDVTSDLKQYNSYDGLYEPYITATLRKGLKIYDFHYKRLGERRDQLDEMKEMVNNDDEYIATSSSVLNSFIGGFTRGHVDTIGAKSSHCKSSWADYNILQNILYGKVRRVDKITPEEKASLQLRRYAAMLCRLSTSQMRLKVRKITDEHIAVIKEKIGGKLFIHDGVFKEKDIREIMSTLDTDMILVDHINKIDFAGRGTAMDNMIGGIPGFVNFQANLAQKRNCAIINLSQVNDKDIQRSDRLSKAPRFWDLYGSSALYHAARELLMLWYPYKDQEDTFSSFSVGSQHTYTINDLWITIEKSSFSKVGKVPLHFEPEYNIFTDKKTKSGLPTDAPKEKGVDLFGQQN